jgi:hypothetical protein
MSRATDTAASAVMTTALATHHWHTAPIFSSSTCDPDAREGEHGGRGAERAHVPASALSMAAA